MTQNTREYQLTTEWDMFITIRLSPYMLRTCCCRICGGFLRRTIQKELSKCNVSDISILAPWQSSKLTASEFPNRTGGRGNPEVAKNDQNGIETHFCSQDKSEIIIGYQDTPNYLDPVSKMTLKVWPGVPSSIGP